MSESLSGRSAIVAPDPLRQSSIARFDNCALSFLLDLQEPPRNSPIAARGTLFHRWVARAIVEMRAQGWTSYPVEMGLELLLQVLAQRDVPDDEVVYLPIEELRWLRVLATRWCEGGEFNAQRVLAVEERLAMEVPCPDGRGGLYRRTVSGQPDVLVADPATRDRPNGIIVVDWKSGWRPPSNEVERAGGYDDDDDQKLSDQGYAQQIIYGGLVLVNYPAVDRVTLREAYLMAGEYREATVKRHELERIMDILGVLISQIDGACEAGPESARWLPTAGTHCGICPAPHRCPIKDFEGIPATPEEALQLAREWIVAAQVRKRRAPLLKGWVDAHGPIEIDEGKGRRAVGWVEHSTGRGRSFKLHEPRDAPASPFDERMEAVLRDR